jgi:carboxylate-amine ligase
MANFSIGIEEEYFLVDAQTKRVPPNVPSSFFDAAKAATEGRVSAEFLQSQVEVITAPHEQMADARAELRDLRQTVSEVAAKHGLAIIASGTHPTALWRKACQTAKKRYDNVMDDLQMIGQRDLLCGMHVHVELPEPDARVDVMRRMLPYLPLFVALSTSSPFWQSYVTGLKGYRLAAYDELPRTGVPELFRNSAEFDAYVGALVQAGVIPDASYIWWAIRPSLKHPTLELRAPDSCTRLEDSLAIAALYRTVACHLYANHRRHADLDAVQRAIVVENKWRAQRYGVHGTFVVDGKALSVADMLDRLIEETAADAKSLECSSDIERCRTIVSAGTSADMQLAVFAAHKEHGDDAEALQAVCDWLATATLQ